MSWNGIELNLQSPIIYITVPSWESWLPDSELACLLWSGLLERDITPSIISIMYVGGKIGDPDKNGSKNFFCDSSSL